VFLKLSDRLWNHLCNLVPWYRSLRGVLGVSRGTLILCGSGNYFRLSHRQAHLKFHWNMWFFSTNLRCNLVNRYRKSMSPPLRRICAYFKHLVSPKGSHLCWHISTHSFQQWFLLWSLGAQHTRHWKICYTDTWNQFCQMRYNSTSQTWV